MLRAIATFILLFKLYKTLGEFFMSSTYDDFNSVMDTYNDYQLRLEQERNNEFNRDLAERQFERDSIYTEEQLRQAQQALELSEKEYLSNKKIQEDNFGLQSAVFDYNKMQNSLMHEREDNAFQRRVADYERAGFSRLSALGSVADSKSSNMLTAPQMDTSGTNQAIGNYNNASSNKISALNNKLQQQNFRDELELKRMQIDLAKIDTIRNLFVSVSDLPRNVLNTFESYEDIKRKKFENEWYEVHGYKEQDIGSVVSDILKRIEDNHGNIGQKVVDSAQNIIDPLSFNQSKTSFKTNPTNGGGSSRPSNYGRSSKEYSLFNKLYDKETARRASNFHNDIKKACDGKFSPFDIARLREDAKRFGFTGVDDIVPDNAKKISPALGQEILQRWNKYLEELEKNGKRF